MGFRSFLAALGGIRGDGWRLGTGSADIRRFPPGRSVQERPSGKDPTIYSAVSHQEAAKAEFGAETLRTACPAVTKVRRAVSFSTTRVPPMNDRLS